MALTAFELARVRKSVGAFVEQRVPSNHALGRSEKRLSEHVAGAARSYCWYAVVQRARQEATPKKAAT